MTKATNPDRSPSTGRSTNELGQMDDRKKNSKRARPYRSPRIETLTGDQILREIGPAQGYSGTVSGVDSPF